jgi:hypothetical protein
MKNILKYFGFLKNGIFKIKSFGQTCVKVFFVFWGQKSKVSQPKVKKGKNVSMVSCLISGEI